MSLSRRALLQQLSGLFAIPLARWPEGAFGDLFAPAADPLLGTIVAYQAGRLRGDYTAQEITRRAIARCEGMNGRLHAIDGLAGSAMEDARASDMRMLQRALRGPLDGVPLFAKSIYDVKGMPTTASSAEWAKLFPELSRRDATEVQRLRTAGAVVLGKTVADDFAYRGNGTSSLSGQVRNPHDPTGLRTPGGSSAGSAVAVACGMAFCALGTDDGGSNRIPAQFTGVVGMKPTFGLVPRGAVIPTWPYLDTHGPLARYVADAALMLDVLAGYDQSDGLSHRTPWRMGSLASLQDHALVGVRLGIVDAHVPREQMTAEARATFDRAVADCERAGAIVERCAPAVTRVNYRELFAEAARVRGDVSPDPNSPAATANALQFYFAGQRADYRQAMERALPAFRAFYDVLPAEWNEVAKIADTPYERDPAGRSFARSRDAVVAQLAKSFKAQQLDALIYPTMPFAAPLAADKWPDIRTALGYGNWLGLPEVSVPAGYSANGMPAGNLSFVGLPGADARILNYAHAYEHQAQRFKAPPL